MLTWLDIRDFVIVDRVTLEFDAGLTVITGETGAGKSIVVDALALLMGGRADAGVIRHGAGQTEMQATFEINKQHAAYNWLIEHELEQNQECMLRRVIRSNKPSRAFINGRACTLQQLKQLGSLLMDIHSQHEHQSLLQRPAQRQLLDTFAKQIDKVECLSAISHELTQKITHLTKIEKNAGERQSQTELLRHELAEFARLAPAENEFAALAEKNTRLSHAEDLITGVTQTLNDLYDSDTGSVSGRLRASEITLQKMSSFDADLKESVTLVRDAAVQVEEASSQLRAKLDQYDIDPQELEAARERMSALHAAARKHHTEPEQLLDVVQRLETELGALDGNEERVDGLKQEIKALESQYDALAKTISEARATAAKKLSGCITKELGNLGMAACRFEIQLEPVALLPRPRYGAEIVEFTVSTNPGQPFSALSKTASGGELSRISLAIQVVCAGATAQTSQIFDEVDVGVGGAVAEVVGQKLGSLARSRQILCITHLPQVAAYGGQHLRVVKLAADSVAVEIEQVEQSKRIEEIARMLGGIKITKQTLAHAKEMIIRSQDAACTMPPL